MIAGQASRWLAALLTVLGITAAAPLAARAELDRAQVALGSRVYRDACLACHGPSGAGMARRMVGFEPPSSFPDFSQCDQSAPEYTRDWRASIVHGGPARGFSEIMPAFGQALTNRDVEAVIVYLRSLCPDRKWAPGELNVPRALVTEKAFPEDEVVLTSSVEARGTPNVSNLAVLEWQFSRDNQLEVELPFEFVREQGSPVQAGIGDITVGVKRVLSFHLDSTATRGSILSVQVEAVLPSGSPSKGIGGGVPQVGGFLAYDVLLPRDAFLQLQAGGDASTQPQRVASSVIANVAIGRSFATDMQLGRLWSPQLELVTERALAAGAVTDFDLIPQLQVTLSQRQHVVADLGFRVALNDTAQRPNQLMLYVLWDWLDGGLTEGW